MITAAGKSNYVSQVPLASTSISLHYKKKITDQTDKIIYVQVRTKQL